jgi:predicted  nucleic acid-binding Zn-ribbon protein
MNTARLATRLSATAGLSLLLLACASKPMPTVQMALANNALDQAVASGASEHAPTELRAARDHQDRARLALQADDKALALSLSQEAQADAELAEARTRAAKARIAAMAVRDGTRVLKEEMGRKVP